MLAPPDVVWMDHPAWCPSRYVWVRVLDVPETSRIVATCRKPAALDLVALDGHDTDMVDIYQSPATTSATPAYLAGVLSSMGRVARVRTTNLWEAIGAAICYKPTVSRPWHSFKNLCRALGEQIPCWPSPRYAMFPSAEVITQETPISLSAMGLGDEVHTLCEAAEAYLQCGTSWRSASPEVLTRALQTVDGIDAHTAQRIAVDISGNYSYYPHDAAFQTWAAKAAPLLPWPGNSEAFTAQWTQACGEYLADLTALLVAWGSYNT